MRIHSLLHESFEDTGYIRVWAEMNGHSFYETCLFSGDPLPSPDECDLVVVMGGSMNVYEEDRYPWLSAEKKFLKSAIDSGKKVLGICLGAQLIAAVLGAEVRKNTYPEIGWFPVEKTDDAEKAVLCACMPDRFIAFHWHGDTFALPQGSIHLFQSVGCKNQGFLYGEKVLGLQFHPEVTKENLQCLVENCPEDIVSGSEYVQTIPEILDETGVGPVHEILSVILEYFGETEE
ncbi:type 1 glutamine amidotransferase [Methanogenium sp. S4BF]|uniref:type 1 glutamine amidotransferase n=1 Tax=Methanogenium sp. S4BF TaxID=1789226 RepID=UPI002416B213|nr:type 1 glutamine amidotransferase [Methanogenium sp. S4BF]WFN35355.1 type 1 glutamine amidotransferase [Methanogenium sp. S4BF]